MRRSSGWVSRVGGVVRAGLLSVLMVTIGSALLATGARALSLKKWEAGTCKETNCSDTGSQAAFYTQAAGHPEYGITDFEFEYKETGLLKAKEPEGKVKDVRVDLPPGLAVDPEVTETCSEAQLDEFKCPHGSEVGKDEATGTANVYEELLKLKLGDTITEDFPVYNMARKPWEPARFGVEINSANLKALAIAGDDLRGHLYLEGGISWHAEPETSESSGVATGDYHEFFKIQNIPQQPEVVESRLIFQGVVKGRAFLTLPSTCSSKPITTLHVDSYEDPGHFQRYTNETPVTATGCGALAFNPSFSLTPETTQSDQPDGVSATLHVPQLLNEPTKPDSPDVQSAEVTLPEGMSLNPSAAKGLEACSSAQFAGGSCPGGSNVGSFSVNAPGIPPGALTGGVYVGVPEEGPAGREPESGGEFRIFLLGEAPQYGVGLQLEGRVKANTTTGRLTAVFANAPQVPVEDLTLHFKGGAQAPLANPLSCGPVQPAAAITPYGGEPPAAAATNGFVVDSNGAGGECPSSLPFALTQSFPPQSPANAGTYDPATFSLSRSDGQQYLSKLTTTLPAGLLGAISSVPLCGEPAANAGSCPATSQIGTVTVAAGAGSEPYSFTGHAYLTGPYGSDPYGLSIVVPAVAGPYNLGEVVTRAGISVGLYSGRVTVTSVLPTIKDGVPLRLKSLSVAVNRKNFLFNPTNCGPLATESIFSGTLGASQSLSSPFQVGNCAALPFKPSVSVSTGGRPTKVGGASLVVKITQAPGQANIREMQLQLPKQLPSRLTTLQKACVAASFEATLPPGSCSKVANVGSVTVTTPVLPGVLKGPAYLISHGGEAFPDLDLVLQGDGVEVVLVGHTHISRNGITTSTFEALPDVPISSVEVDLPMGGNSALATNGRLCHAGLVAPTTIIAQNGAKITQSTKIAVKSCPIELISHKRRGSRMIVKVWVPEAGRLTVSGRGARSVVKRVKKAGEVKLSVPLGAKGMAMLQGHGKKKLKLRVGFKPKAGHNTSAAALALR
ncbi:MAG TPA: hypothetical protein VK680_06490 [Solirubrobacteraceae bacterium]|jgi:hypothetical protein|nr:hypothetical protein [Solirubrobacteraceae bacterium]